MVRQDIITCLKNALERGESINQAKISLINAGYPRKDINEAAQELEGKIKKLDVPLPKFLPKLPKI